MKTVSGNVISSKPISLSKATRSLSTFISTDTGASQAINAYLRRTLASFKELMQLHKELKTPRAERKRKRHVSDTVDNGEMTTSENPTQSIEATQELSQVSAPKRKKHRKEKAQGLN